jgi:hypothetical protein
MMSEEEKAVFWNSVVSEYQFQHIIIFRVENGFTIQPDTRTRPTHIAKDQGELDQVIADLLAKKKQPADKKGKAHE